MKSPKFDWAFKQLINILNESKITFKEIDDISPSDVEWGEFVIVIGEDSDILKTIHKTINLGLPVLGVNESDGGRFFSELSLDQLPEALKLISRGKFRIDESKTLQVKNDRFDNPSAVNEVAIFPYRSATFLEYILKIDDEEIWTDRSDGVIIATPTGSTAYAMSAGGPIVLPGANVFTIVSVNSLDITRRPIIVPETSVIRIENISSGAKCEIIIDGVYRSKIGKTVEVKKSLNNARIVKLPKDSPTAEIIAKKVLQARDLLSMPPSAKFLLKTLEYEGPLRRSDIMKRTLLPDRTASLALSILLEKGLVKRKLSLKDSREKVYYVA